LAAADVGARKRLAVAAQAGVDHFFRHELGKRDDGRLASAGGHVIATRPVTAFAACVGRGFAARCNALIMRVPEKKDVNVWVARAADVAADIIGGFQPAGACQEENRNRGCQEQEAEGPPHATRQHSPTITHGGFASASSIACDSPGGPREHYGIQLRLSYLPKLMDT